MNGISFGIFGKGGISSRSRLESDIVGSEN